MTIQEIRDLIAKKITGQGTQVDLGNGLPAILNGILDAVEGASMEPLIVEGSYDSSLGEFSENTGEPSYQQAKEAFESGRPVFLQFADEESDSVYNALVFSYVEDGEAGENSLRAGVAKWLEPA